MGDHGALGAEQPLDGWLKSKMTAVSQAAKTSLPGCLSQPTRRAKRKPVRLNAGSALVG